MTLCIVLDVSGSMREMVKTRIEALVLDCIAMVPDAHPPCRFFHWGEAMVEVDRTIPITPKGKASFPVLESFLAREKYVLLLTDGTFPLAEMKDRQSFAEAARDCTLRIIAIGGDADFFTLEKLAGAGHVFGPEDLFAALEVFDGMD